ncbi:MAG: hypothetical protein M0R30_03665 [Methanoregula sp.]|uniref:hypothetical protein n=1 Tax=Methanoregula sp. TaxID=2052170 RepID=UPI0025E5216D|nr:hypothetical protein [Methanoregula sp.]MCK9630717.1 hypothetical protein [Methanoregula sp.]
MLIAIVPVAGSSGGSPAAAGGDAPVTITPLVNLRYGIGEDTITFSGTNTDSNATYLVLSGPNLDSNGVRIDKDWPRKYPVTDGDASTFMAVSVGPDNTWSYTWDTHDVAIDSGTYTVYAASTPRDKPHINETNFARISFLMLPPKDRDLPMVKIAPLVNLKYYIGEDTITFSGINTASNTTYLVLSGPNLDIKGSQIQKDLPRKYPVTDGDASTFMATSVGSNNTWSYTWDTHNVAIDSGMYIVYAASSPRDIPHINSTHFNMISFLMLPPRDMVLPTETVPPSSESVPVLQDRVAETQNQSVAGQTRNTGDSGNLLDQAWGFLSGIF